MHDSTGHPENIPHFLRRPKEAAPAALRFRARTGAEARAPRPALPHADRAIHGGVAPVRPDFLAASSDDRPAAPAASETAAPAAAETAARVTPKAKGAVPQEGVVDLTAHRDAAKATARNGASEGLEADEDLAFQVTLPRSVIRQIRLLAAQEGTTHRAIVLRALRSAGVSIPAGADVDRRGAAARRRQQA